MASKLLSALSSFPSLLIVGGWGLEEAEVVVLGDPSVVFNTCGRRVTN